MKKILLGAFLATIGLVAADYSSYSAEELVAMSGKVPVEEQEAYKKALEQKLSQLSPQQREAVLSKAKEQTQAPVQEEGTASADQAPAQVPAAGGAQ